MTPQQQLAALGISAQAYDGIIIIEMERPINAFDPGEIRRFHRFLERAYKDALHRDKRQAEVER